MGWEGVGSRHLSWQEAVLVDPKAPPPESRRKAWVRILIVIMPKGLEERPMRMIIQKMQAFAFKVGEEKGGI